MTDRAASRRSTLETELVAAFNGALAGQSVADIGAGSGAVTRLLAHLGAQATGFEPNPAAVVRAEAQGGGPTYVTAGADALGGADGRFDAAVFSYSLHHCPNPEAALLEAARVARPGGRIIVIEPIADGAAFAPSRFIDDETAVYDLALKGMAAFATSGAATHSLRRAFTIREPMESPEAFLDRMITVDNGRRLDPADRPAFEAAYAAALEHDDDGPFMEEWTRIDVFEIPG